MYRFLSLFLLLSVFVGECISLSSPPPPQIETVPVVIIGAGTAGIFAANKLASRNVSSVILEARNRIGGRMDTHYVEGYPYPIEMGCSFIHDGNISPWPNISATSGISIEEWDDYDIQFVENGRKLSQVAGYDILTRFTDLWDAHFNFSRLGRSDSDALTLAGYTEVDNEIESVLAAIETEPAINLEFHDSTGWDPYPEEVLGSKYIIPGGYIQLLNYVFNQYPLASQGLRLQSKVTAIDYRKNDGSVLITYTDLVTMQTKTIKATKGVIITLPIGVLKAKTVTFTPALPRQVQYSINKVSFGTAMKVALLFDWQVAPRLGQDKHNWYWRVPQGCNPRYEDGIVLIFNHQHMYGQPVLQSFFTGQYAAQMELKSDAEIIATHMEKIREFLPNLPDPVNYIISRWGQDPYARGVYADYSVGTTTSDFEIFQVPLGTKQNILFGGEHDGTWTQSPKLDQGTTNQAATTGIWAAERILSNSL